MKQGTVRKDARNEADAKKIEERNKEMKERLKQIKERKATTANLLSKAHEGARKGGGIDLKEEVSNDQEPEVLARSCGGGSTVDVENPVTSVIDEAHEGTRKGGGIDLKEEVSNDQEPEVLARSCGVGSTVDVENPVISVNAEIHGGTTTVGDIPLKEVSNHLESEVMAGSCGGGSISSVKFEGRTLLEPSNLQNDDGSSALPNRMKFTEEDLPQVKDRILKNIMRARYFKELMEKARENPLLNTQLKTLLEPSNLQNDDSSSAPPHQMKFSGEELPHIKDHILKNIMRARYFKELLEKTRENNPLLNTKGMTIEQETSVSNGTPTPKGDEPCVTSMEERTSTKDTSDGCTIGGECSKASVKESSSKPRTRLKNIEDGSTSTDSDSMDILLKPKRQSKSRRARKQEMRERYKILKKRCEKFQEQKLTLVDEAHEGARKGGGIDLKEEVSNDQEPEVLARSCGGGSTVDVEYPVIYIDVEGITLELENSLYKRTRTPKGDEPCVTSMEERTSTKDTSDGCSIGGECSKATVKLNILLEPSNLQNDDSSSAPPYQMKFSEEELPQIEGSILKSIIRARYFEELLEKIRENNPYFNIKGLTIEVEASVSNGTPTSKGDEPCVTSMEERTSTKDTSDGCTIGGECSKASVKLNILLEPSNLQNDDSSSAPPYQMKFSEEELPQIKDYILKGIMRTRYFKELLEKTRENNPPLNIKGMTIGLETSVSNGTPTTKGDEPCVTSMEERTSTKDTSDGCTIGGECSKASVKAHEGTGKGEGIDLKEEVSNDQEPEVLARSCGGGSTVDVENPVTSVNAKAHKGARKGGGIDLKEEVSNDQEPGVLVRSCGSCSTVDVEKPIKSFSAEEERDKLIEELEAFRKDFYPLYGIKCKDNADDMENSQHIYECTFERERMRDRKEALRQKRDKILRPVVTSRRGIRSRRLRKRLERFEAENPPSEEELNEDFETLRRAYGPKHDTDSEVEDFEIMEYISLCRLKREHMEQRREILIAKHEGMLRREDDLELRQERQQRLKRQLEQILTHSLKNETDSEQGECMEGLEDSMSLNDVEKSIIKKKKKSKKSKRGAVMEGDEGGTKCNPRKVGKMISKSGKRKKGTKHVPTETDNIPQHAARKKRNPKLEAYRLMLEEKQKEAFEKTKERTRPGINPKYHYLNQKKPAQNVIERAIPGPPRPATKSKLIKPVANKRCNLKVEAMRLEEKRRQKEAFEESKLKTRPGINPKYHYLNRKRPSQEDRAETVPACRKPNRLAANQHKMGARQNTNSDHGVSAADRQLIPRGVGSLPGMEDSVDHHPTSRVKKPNTVHRKPRNSSFDETAAEKIEEETKGGRKKMAKFPNMGVSAADRQLIPRGVGSLPGMEDSVDHHPTSRVRKPDTVHRKPRNSSFDETAAEKIEEETKGGRKKMAKFSNKGVSAADRQLIPRGVGSLPGMEDSVDHHPTSRVKKPDTVHRKPRNSSFDETAAEKIEEETKGGRKKMAKFPNKGVSAADRQLIPRGVGSLPGMEDSVDHHPTSRVKKPDTVHRKPRNSSFDETAAEKIEEETKGGRKKMAKFPNMGVSAADRQLIPRGVGSLPGMEDSVDHHPTSRVKKPDTVHRKPRNSSFDETAAEKIEEETKGGRKKMAKFPNMGVSAADRQLIPRGVGSLPGMEDSVDHHPTSRVKKPDTVHRKPRNSSFDETAAEKIEEETKGGRKKMAKFPNMGVSAADRQLIPRGVGSLPGMEDSVDHHPTSRVKKPDTVHRKPRNSSFDETAAEKIEEETKGGRKKMAKFSNKNAKLEAKKGEKMGVPRENAAEYHNLAGKPTSRRID